MDRRKFLKQTFQSGVILSAGNIPYTPIPAHELLTLTILHTNDMHSRVEPFPMDGSRNQGLGGLSKRASLIGKIKQQQQHTLLLDAGDIFQGTPYFNFYEGEVEMKAMKLMGYDAATIGNHDYDAGMDNLKDQLALGGFPMINCNYLLQDTALGDIVLPFKIFEKGGIKIGVTGVGIELAGLVPKHLYGNSKYQDPVSAANLTAAKLKNDMGCDYIICLSHLGYKYRGEQVDDLSLAAESEHIDLIIGGHTHSFLNVPDILENKSGKPVIVNQVGWAGIMLGRIDISFERNKKNRCDSCTNLFIGRV